MRKNVDEQLYTAWVNMRQRCYNKNKPDYKYYTNIFVDPLWEDFEEFEAWAYSVGYKNGLTLDRINVEDGYYSDNCRWVSRTVQMQNTRKIYNHNTTGYRGIQFRTDTNKYRVVIRAFNTTYNLGCYESLEDAINIYNSFIIENNLYHPLQGINE